VNLQPFGPVLLDWLMLLTLVLTVLSVRCRPGSDAARTSETGYQGNSGFPRVKDGALHEDSLSSAGPTNSHHSPFVRRFTQPFSFSSHIEPVCSR